MDNRKLLANAAASPPTPPASPSIGYPSNGNPASSIPAAVGGAYWFYQQAEELRNVILGASIVPSDTDLTQLLQALTAGWNLARSHTTNGYQKLPGGLILQWGQVAFADLGTGPVGTNFSFPIAFPSVVYALLATPAMTSAFNVMPSFQASITSLNGGQIVLQESSALTQTGLFAYWLALGK